MLSCAGAVHPERHLVLRIAGSALTRDFPRLIAAHVGARTTPRHCAGGYMIRPNACGRSTRPISGRLSRLHTLKIRCRNILPSVIAGHTRRSSTPLAWRRWPDCRSNCKVLYALLLSHFPAGHLPRPPHNSRMSPRVRQVLARQAAADQSEKGKEVLEGAGE